MSDQFLGEIRIFPFGFTPQGWAACNGQLLPISQNTALFSLLGAVYGGDGRSTFGLPNFQGRAPIDVGDVNGRLTTRNPGDVGGETTVTLIDSQMPAHSHQAKGSSQGGDQDSPANGVWSIPSAGRGLNVYDPGAGTPSAMKPLTSTLGGDQPHDNMMPYLTLNFCIALVGIYPQRQ